ncbi:DNA-processing protein DprA [Maritalea mobilis]|uniref:DNA-processing protein DprA n=1 Tax=Maritalea mobilis TaxID=483324 RepID=UPI001C97886F|nr:DNA-processing protein DprA [Maritalea mobilis]MBY6202514.1 DNA-processing protein DprA [Maritalea mobilis]
MWTVADSPPAAQWADAAFYEVPVSYTPPPADGAAERLARLRLIRSRRVGPATYLRLMAEHGAAHAALDALPEVARAAGVEAYTPCPEPVAAAEMRAAERLGARMLCLGDPDYPAALAEISDAPPILWALGDLSLLARPALAMVGTRNASALGARMARRLAADLGAAGFTVVSGLARGIDALAHSAALGTGTIAVQAGGLDVIYPTENTELAHDIARQGLRLSEMPFGLHPQARHFPRRNRIVSGLARAVIVVEAAARSGSLITARCAADQGREVMAVPGHPMDSRASGANLLIRDGALLIRSAEDVIEALGQPAPAPLPQSDTATRMAARQHARQDPPRPQQPTPPGGIEALILDTLGPSPVAEDQLIRDLARPPREVAQALAILEMAGRITRAAGGMVSRTS